MLNMFTERAKARVLICISILSITQLCMAIDIIILCSYCVNLIMKMVILYTE